MQLPIGETHSHKEILGFETLDDDYPQDEHKELKRSDSHAITMQTANPFVKNHRPNETNSDDDRSAAAASVHARNTNYEKNIAGSTYDKVLLTPQDQYIPTLPKVIISASASVTDASGKKLNYSVGNVIASNIKLPPLTYDEYREDDVSLDPFFIDVPKIAPRRGRRNIRATAIANSSAKLIDPTKNNALAIAQTI